MPVYEYRCKKCGYEFERVQKLSESPVRRCERCGGAVTKLISPSGLMFKGTGWYVTDYSSKMKEKKTKTGDDKDVKKEKETTKPVSSSNKPSDK